LRATDVGAQVRGRGVSALQPQPRVSHGAHEQDGSVCEQLTLTEPWLLLLSTSRLLRDAAGVSERISRQQAAAAAARDPKRRKRPLKKKGNHAPEESL
jgi:hypothetical protein